MSISGPVAPEIVVGLLLGEKPTMERKEQVAQLLADKVGREHPFTVGYVENIAAGRQECSPDGEMYLALSLIMDDIVVGLTELVEKPSLDVSS